MLDGKKLVDKQDFNVSYKNNTNIGRATLTIKGKGNYTGTITRTFKITPVRVGIKSLTGKKKALKVSYYVPAGDVSFQIRYKEKGTTAWKNIFTSKSSYKIKNLKSKRYYKLRVRAIKKVGNVTYYGDWSEFKQAKVK